MTCRLKKPKGCIVKCQGQQLQCGWNASVEHAACACGLLMRANVIHAAAAKAFPALHCIDHLY
jgi:hypothetical protein